MHNIFNALWPIFFKAMLILLLRYDERVEDFLRCHCNFTFL